MNSRSAVKTDQLWTQGSDIFTDHKITGNSIVAKD